MIASNLVSHSQLSFIYDYFNVSVPFLEISRLLISGLYMTPKPIVYPSFIYIHCQNLLC